MTKDSIGQPTYRYYYYHYHYARFSETPRIMIPVMSATYIAMRAVVDLTKDTPGTRTEIIPGHDYEDDIARQKIMLAAFAPPI